MSYFYDGPSHINHLNEMVSGNIIENKRQSSQFNRVGSKRFYLAGARAFIDESIEART